MNKYERSEQKRQKYAKRRSLHQCVRCGTIDKRTLAGGATCAACAENSRRESEILRQRHRAELRCTRCGYQDERTLAGRHHCEFCAAKDRASARRYRAEQKEERST